MPFRIYTVNQKFVKNKNGDIGVYKKKIKKWIKSSKPYRSQKRGMEKKSIYSTRFGFLDLYNRKEQQELICPSGYSISQCFNVLLKTWYGYHKARHSEKDHEGMVKYAIAIQTIQEDMGLPIATFPQLGLYCDVFSPNNIKRSAFEGRSELKEKRLQVDDRQDSTKIQQKLLIPNKAKGESILTISDFGAGLKYKAIDDNKVPQLLEPDEGEKVLDIVDEIPFHNSMKKSNKKKGEAIFIYADDELDFEIIEEVQDTVPQLLEPDEGEKVLSTIDDIYFQS